MLTVAVHRATRSPAPPAGRRTGGPRQAPTQSAPIDRRSSRPAALALSAGTPLIDRHGHGSTLRARLVCALTVAPGRAPQLLARHRLAARLRRYRNVGRRPFA